MVKKPLMRDGRRAVGDERLRVSTLWLAMSNRGRSTAQKLDALLLVDAGKFGAGQSCDLAQQFSGDSARLREPAGPLE